MNQDLIAALREKLGLLDKMRRSLKYSYAKIGGWWRVDVSFDAWTEDQLESLAAFKARFAELQDHLASTMRLIATIEEEDTQRFTYVLNYMTQLYILDDIDEWLAVRNLRNATTHDYSASEAEKALHFHSLFQHTDFLFETMDRLERFVSSAYPVNSGKQST